MGVDLGTRFRPAKIEREDNELLFVGRLVEKKGLRYLLDAMPAVLKQRPEARLRIAGFGPEEVALKTQAEALGIAAHVDFLGAVLQANLPALYQRATLLVAPFVEARSGDQEGLGLVLVEASGCGCPIVAGNVPAVRDVLGTASHCLVDPRDSDALVRAILHVMKNPTYAREEAENLRARLLEWFDWQAVADAYADVLAHHARS